MSTILNRVWISDTALKRWIREYVGLFDITSLLLDIYSINGEAMLIVEEECVISCIEEAARVCKLAGVSKIEIFKNSGNIAKPGDVILKVVGDGYSIHSSWRIVQNLVTIFSGIATKIRNLVNIVKTYDPNIVLAVARRGPPGLRNLLLKSTIAGGAIPYRLTLQDSIIILRNHIQLLGGFEQIQKYVNKIKRQYPFKLVCIEVTNIEEALQAAKIGIDMIQITDTSPEEAHYIISEVRREYPNIIIAIYGDIDENNIIQYIKSRPNIIITTTPYNAKPIKTKTEIRKI